MSKPTQAALTATLAQIVSIAVGYGVVNNQQAGAIIAISMALVNAAALIAHAIHANATKTASVLALPGDIEELGSVPPETLEEPLPTAVKPDLGVAG